MNKFIFSIILGALFLALSGCVVETVSYDPGYRSNYVYSVGYYNSNPYWANNYNYYGYTDYTGYSGYPYGYWGNYEYFGSY